MFKRIKKLENEIKDSKEEIKELKEANIIKPTLAWWLYFGK